MEATKLLEKWIEDNTAIMLLFRADDGALVYLNRKGREYIHAADESGYVGRCLFDLFPFMENTEAESKRSALSESESMIWDCYNENNEYQFRIKEALIISDGVKYITAEIEDRLCEWRKQRGAEKLAENEKTVNEALKLALSEKSADKGINVLIRFMGEKMESDRFYIFEENPDHTYSNTYEWCREGVEPEMEGLQNIPYEGYVELWYQEFRDKKYILIDNLENDNNIDRKIYDILEPQHIRSLVVAPLVMNGEIRGFYGVDNPPHQNLKNIISLYQLLGHFISLLISYRDNMKLLNQYSYMDQLSGLKNRHALDEFTDSIDPDKSLCYIFCDINGLKKVNDTEGHAAGDRLIKRTACALRTCFSCDNVYRMGGDEFLVAIQGLTEKEAAGKVEELQKYLNQAGLSVATGEVWNKDGRIASDAMLLEADKRMYSNKREIYGERRRVPWPPLSIAEYREG